MRMLTGAVVLAAVVVATMGAIVVPSPREDPVYPEVVVSVDGIGSVLGNKKPTHNKVKEVWHFLGIPYAEQPSRFSPPTSFKTLNETHDGTYRRQMCPQSKFYPTDLMGETIERLLRDSQDVGEGEDCLTLDIYTPMLPNVDGTPANPKLLPVFFFIHGGAFVVGSSKSAQPDYILEREDMVLVSIQYRLGPLGFLSFDGGEGNNVSNAGLHDQVWALNWTHKHIEHFGGDPNDITIGGVSAGGATSGLLYVSPKTREWVKGALLFSGCSVVPWTIDLTPEHSVKGHADLLDCGNMTKDALLDCLRNVNYTDLVNATFFYARKEKAQGRVGMGGTIPVVDGYLLNTMPEDILKEKDFPGRPLVIGVTKHEGMFVFPQLDVFYIKENGFLEDQKTLKQEFGDILLRFAGIHDTQHVLGETIQRLYFRENQLGNYEAMWAGTVDYTGAAYFKAPAWHMAKLNSDRGGTSFLYTFNYISQDGRRERRPLANHGSDQIYLFPARNESFMYRSADMRMVEQFTEMVANFVVHKDPRTRGTESIHGARWLPANRNESNYLVIDDNWEGKKEFTNEYFVVNTGISLRASGALLLAIVALFYRV